MKKIVFLLIAGFFLISINIPGQTAICASSDYNIFLMSRGQTAPADLINENAYETAAQKFTLAYDLVNATDDVLQAKVELYRYLDEDAMNEGWKLEQTLAFNPPFSSSTPVVFSNLKRGKTYSISLIVVSDMPNLSLRDGSAPIDITVKTLYFLWPKENGMHVSAENSFEGEPRTEHFKIRWASAEGVAKTKVKAHHSDNSDNPIIEGAPEGELTFPAEEVWAWPYDNVSSISIEALDSTGGTTATTMLPIPGPNPISGFKPPCLDCHVLPCRQVNPVTDPEVSGPNDKVLNDGVIKVVVSETYGGAFFSLKLLSQNVNLINNSYVDGTPDGVLCQTAITRKNDRWPQYDGSNATQERWLTNDGLHLKCGWENDPDAQYTPGCFQGNDALYHWNQNQGGAQVGCGTTSNQNWGVYLRKHDNSYICETPVPPPWEIISPPCTPSKTLPPSYSNISTGGTTSPITYCSILPDWVPYTELPTSSGPDANGKYWNFQGQPKAAIKSKVELIPSFIWQGSACSGIKITSRYVVHCDCAEAGSENCHCAAISFPQFPGSSLNNQKSYEFGVAIQNWIFFGSEPVKHAYKFDSTWTGNVYGMVDRPRCSDVPSNDNCIYDYGDNANLAPEGWKFHPSPNPNWVPYTLLSTEVVNNQRAWILIYSPDLSSSSTPHRTELKRIWQGASTPSTGVYGYVAAPITSLEKLTDSSWSDVSETCIFVGPTMDAVMHYLQDYTNGEWPRYTVTYSISGTVTCNGTGLSGVTMTLSGTKSSTTTTASDGTYSFTGLIPGNYTVTPSKSGYTFSPPNAAFDNLSANQTGVNFTATAAQLYSISGTITCNSAGLPGVTVTAGSSTTTSAWDGTYTIPNLPNGTYTVVPSKNGYTFSPTSISVTISGGNQTGKNFTATATSVGHSISGSLKGYTGTAIANYAIDLTGTASATTKTDQTGYYQFTGLSNGLYTVEPQPSGIFVFMPPYRDVSLNDNDVTQVNFTARRIITRGMVTDLQGNGVSGITITAGNATAITDMTGSYYFTESDLPLGSYTIAPSAESALVYTFSPSIIPVTISSLDKTITDQNFTVTHK